jgi:hypothetical protein
MTTPPTRALASDVDPVRFEVIRNALLAITEEMGATLRRAAYSTNIKTRGDFSCAFFDRDLRTIAQAFAQPAHLGSLAHLVPRAIKHRRSESGHSMTFGPISRKTALRVMSSGEADTAPNALATDCWRCSPPSTKVTSL